MPLYEYECLDCEDSFETRRTLDQAADPVACPSCDSLQTRKFFGRIALISAHGQLDSPLSLGSGCACACGNQGCGCM